MGKSCSIKNCNGRGSFDKRYGKAYFNKGYCHYHYQKLFVIQNKLTNRSRIINNKKVRFGAIDKRLISNFYTRICGICDIKIESSYEIDHIIPLARNGSHEVENLQLVHPICNRSKGAKLQSEMVLDIKILREYVGI